MYTTVPTKLQCNRRTALETKYIFTPSISLISKARERNFWPLFGTSHQRLYIYFEFREKKKHGEAIEDPNRL